MIIACPACATRYVVPDSAIGVGGRTVRCAKCRQSWNQEGQEGAVTAEPAAAAALFAWFALGTVVAVSYWGLPDWVPISRPTFGLGQSDLVLDFPQDKQY